MRILAAFFTILFTFINPVMILKVVSESERILNFNNTKNHTNVSVTPELIEAAIKFVAENDLTSKIKTAIYVSVLTMTLLHIGLTCMCLYGIYSCRPALVRPLLFDIGFSFFFLLTFVIFSLIMYWKLNSNGSIGDHEQSSREHLKQHLRNLYVGAAFLFTYAFWLIVSFSGYRDTKKMHADFMYWIVEERMSMRSHVHNVSADNRSDRSSKGSKASRTSKGSSRSVRSEHWAHSRPNSVTASIGSKRASIVNARLSVPL